MRKHLRGHLATHQGRHVRAHLTLFQVGMCSLPRNRVLPRARGERAARPWRWLPQDRGFCVPVSPGAPLGHCTEPCIELQATTLRCHKCARAQRPHQEWTSPAPSLVPLSEA